ncbi:hypothetical protein VB780_29720 [Leptolyngbya sp. CCNP1308]|uniref:hypothetical protein n=1 Tax=Leptolyngbya sp. CCNP1308 TaxID=3110255 RepID=UPI002B21DD3D|nr:hypothetical protein [Leptolyngbya sp. CCNP1308]MEA5452787.1 hypothetical protein [Leptolyngbya sp. CCNP1308]
MQTINPVALPRLTESDRTIKIRRAYGYTDPNDWSGPIPVPPTSDILSSTSNRAEMWMAIATRTELIE